MSKAVELNNKTRMTVAEAGTGADVWMIIEQVHQTKPLLVTIGNQCAEMHLLMSQYYIKIHDREGIEGKNDFHKTFIRGLHSLVSANNICYINEEDAQAELDKQIKQREEYKRKTILMYSNFVKNHIKEFTKDEFKNEDNFNSYVNGCIDAIMFLRNHRYILDRQPDVEGITKFRSFEDDYFYGKED